MNLVNKWKYEFKELNLRMTKKTKKMQFSEEESV